MSTSSEGLSTCSDGDDRNKLIDMITQTVTSVCDVAAISVGGRPRTARGLRRRKDEDGDGGERKKNIRSQSLKTKSF